MMKRVYESLNSSPRPRQNNASEGPDRTTRSTASSHQHGRRPDSREQQVPLTEVVPHTIHSEIIEKLQVAFDRIGWKRTASDLNRLPAASQKILQEILQSCTPEMAQNGGAMVVSRIKDGNLPLGTRSGDSEDLEVIPLKKQTKLQKELQSLNDANKELQLRLNLSTQRVQDLEHDKTALLDSILDRSGGEEVLDGDLTQRFVSLRQQIQRIGNSRLYVASGKSTCPDMSISDEENDDLYRAWCMANSKDRNLIMRAQLFRLIFTILSRNMFGVVGVAADSAQEKQEFRGIESSLSNLEDMLHRNTKVSKADITNWRLATLKCVQSCQQDDREINGSAEYMYSIFERFITAGAAASEIEKLKQRYSQLCRDTIRIKILMRGSEDEYRCLGLRNGARLSENEEIADFFAVYKGTDEDSGPEIEFTLFGALVKYPRNGAGVVVLEKALVVMTRRD